LFVVFCFAFSPINFAIFILTGFLISLILHLILSVIFRLRNPQIPLAAYLSIWFIIVAVLQFPLEKISLYHDLYLIQFLT
jgi:hypothetical protein